MREFLLGFLVAGTFPLVHSCHVIRFLFSRNTPNNAVWWVKATAVTIPVIYIVMLVWFNYLSFTNQN